MASRFAFSIFVGSLLFAQPSLAASCPKPELVRKAIALQDVKTGIDDDPIGGGVSAKRQRETGIDDDPIGGGISSDPEWKTAEDIAGAFDIFGDGSTYVVLQGARIDEAGSLMCVYGFSEASGLGFVPDRGAPRAYITLKRGICRTASRGWRQQRSGDKKTGAVGLLCNASEASCNFNCR